MKNIVISGSMQFFEDMKKYAALIEEKHFGVILPEEDDWDSIKPDQINAYKKMVSQKHFDAIADSNTYAVFVVNNCKKGVQNYIGANTFAEIAIAFYFGKKIYLINDIFDPYADELTAWGAIALKNNVQLIE
jgi:hypothetical protein